MLLFTFKDKNEKTIYLTKERWLHINREHPEIIRYLPQFEDILLHPAKIVNHIYDSNIKYFYKFIKDRKYNPRCLMLIVKYLNGSGFIITAYFVRHIK